ncbi:MAG: phospholipase D-like domain-containing protein, partial [Elusimicrobiota bacterium]
MRQAALYALAVLLWSGSPSAWAQQIRPVNLPAAGNGVPVVPGVVASPRMDLRLDRLTGVSGIPAPGIGVAAVPSISIPAGASFAGEAVPSLPIHAAPAPALPPAVPAQWRDESRMAGSDQAGRNSFERLSADIPFSAPEPADLQGQKEYADRSFDFKLGAESQGADAVAGSEAMGRVETAAGAPLDIEAAGRGRAEKPVEEPVSTSDDGGGADYPVRKVVFNKREFPSVALRPNVPVEDEIVKAIKASRKTIRLALYEFKNRAVMDALSRAKRRGVKIQLIVDYSNVFPKNDPDAAYRMRRSNELWSLIRDGYDLRVLRGTTAYGINHNKFAIFDGKLAQFGSYNYSFTSENSHYENALFTTQKSRVWALKEYYDYLLGISVPFAQAKEHSWPQAADKPPTGAQAGAVDLNGTQLPAVLFMPDGSNFEDTVVKALDAAKTSVDVAMFALRSRRITDALVRAHERGVKVRMVMDESQSTSEYFGPFVQWLAGHGIAVKTLAGPNPDSDFPMAEKTHHKFMILDGKVVETGSANWTKRASVDNYENAHFLDDKTDVGAFSFAFEHMFKIAQVFAKPEAPPVLPTDEELLRDILNPPPPKPTPPAPDLPEVPAPPMVAFNGVELPSYALLPSHPIAPNIIKAIDAAKRTVRLALYEFTSEAILESLRRARTRGVKVEIVLDRNHVYTSGINHEDQPRKPKAQVVALAKEGFDMKILRGKRSGVMHNKIVLVDDELAGFGSYNLTDVAEQSHFENFIFSKDAGRVSAHLKYFQYMRGLAEDLDMAKLDEILARTFQSMQDAKEAGETSGVHIRRPEYPPPPQDADQPVKLNDQSFPRQLFSPQGAIEAALIRAIKAAKVSVEI